MSDVDGRHDPTSEVERLQRRLDRERAARHEAEAIAEDATRRLFDLVQELESTNRELQRVNDDLEAFVYTTSHDLKSPLVTVIGYLDVLKMELGDALDEDQADYLHRIRSQAGYMRDLVRDLLELSRVGRVSTEVGHIPTAAVVRELAEDRTRRHDGLEVEIGELPDLRLNPVRARQLFANLLDNAIAHAGRDRIVVRVHADVAEDDGVVFTVEDNGQGIDADDRERIFAPFERRRGSRVDGETGDAADASTTGLGLTICRKIVTSYDGEIWAAPSQTGAVVRFQLPSDVVVG